MIDFDRKHIDLPAAITKDGQRRIVDMSDNLIEWLFLCLRPSGKILPENFRRKRWALGRAMNWKDGWPEDILRRSYGSYHLAKYRTLPSLPINWDTRTRGCSLRIIERS